MENQENNVVETGADTGGKELHRVRRLITLKIDAGWKLW